MRLELKDKLAKQFSEISNFASQYKYQELHKRLRIHENNAQRINKLEKSIVDYGDLLIVV